MSNIKYGVGYKNLYGVEFSISGEYVYITQYDGAFYRTTFDDFMSGNTSLTNLNINLSNVKLGPDGKMYGIRESQNVLYVIMDPEDGATDIRTFSTYLTHVGRLGLPVFTASWFYIDGQSGFCVNTSQEFSVAILESTISSTIWNFGDGTPEERDTNVTVGTQLHSHTYTKPGKYTITVRTLDDSDGLLKQESFEVEVLPCIIPVNPNTHVWN
ncbi:MAG: PKD domain-containing protein [Prevotella sp.]|nr:PKD domain-containing protein [Prevotella sp.]